MPTKLDLPQDYLDFLHALSEADAEFLSIGGWAVAVHGHASATDDLDVLVRPSADNAVAVVRALQTFGAPMTEHNVTEGLFARPRYGYDGGAGRPRLFSASAARSDVRALTRGGEAVGRPRGLPSSRSASHRNTCWAAMSARGLPRHPVGSAPPTDRSRSARATQYARRAST